MPSLKKNIAALYVVQLTNYAIPLFTLPCLTRALGPAGFGRYNFCLGVVTYFVLLVDYGFNFSATQEIARHREDRLARSKIFWSTTAVRTLLALAGVAVLLLSTVLVERLMLDRRLLLLGYLTVIGGLMTPGWYFQGTEDMALSSGVGLAYRLASIPSMYWLVQGPEDLDRAILIYCAPSVLAGMSCLAVLARRRAVGFVRVSGSDLIATLRGGWHMFLSTAAISLYTTTNVVLLGFVAGDAAVGYFSSAEKLTRAATALMSPINQSFYPRISRLLDESQDRAFALIRKLLRMQGVLGALVSITLAVAAPSLIRLLIGPQFSPAIEVVRWLSPLPLLITLSNVLGVQTMLPLRMQRTVTAILVLTGRTQCRGALCACELVLRERRRGRRIDIGVRGDELDGFRAVVEGRTHLSAVDPRTSSGAES